MPNLSRISRNSGSSEASLRSSSTSNALQCDAAAAALSADSELFALELPRSNVAGDWIGNATSLLLLFALPAWLCDGERGVAMGRRALDKGDRACA